MAGVRALLSGFWPSVDHVGLMIYPGLKSTSPVSIEYDCNASTPSNSSTYNIATSDTISDLAHYSSSPAYMIIPLESTYQVVPSGSNTGPLNTTDPLVKAAGGVSGCTGVTAVGGVSTFFADAIATAQTALETNGRAKVQKAIVLLSDGDANAHQTITYNEVDGSSNPVYLKDDKGHFIRDRQGNKTQATIDLTNMTTEKKDNQCHQAIVAAQAATNAGTWVYSIAYGASTSSSTSCSTDSSYRTLSACETMRQIASDDTKFFSDKLGGSCTSQAHSTSELVSIFQNVGTDMTSARLIPDNTM